MSDRTLKYAKFSYPSGVPEYVHQKKIEQRDIQKIMSDRDNNVVLLYWKRDVKQKLSESHFHSFDSLARFIDTYGIDREDIVSITPTSADTYKMLYWEDAE